MEKLKVQLIHGLEGSPNGAKAQFLASRFDALTPGMDTRDFEGSIRVQAEAITRFRPDVLVGSSFGGAVAAALLQRGSWHGPTVLLAPALEPFGVEPSLPAGAPVVIVHGIADDIVPIEASRRLARACDPAWVTLVEVDDGHRLGSLLESERLADIVREVAGPPSAR